MIYLDNAATSWPKPDVVIEAMEKTIRSSGFNSGRGVHQGSLNANRLTYETRELLAKLINAKEPNNIVLTFNATMSLNIAIKGILKPGDHVITTTQEHNSVWRPIKYLETKGIEIDKVTCDAQGFVDPEDFRKKIKKNTKLIITTHASNVIGTILPIKQIGQIAHENKILYMVDASQTIGTIPINVEIMNIDILAFPGHKGLLGPQGTGGLYVAPYVEIQPLLHGGTGSSSELETQPDSLPDKLESGTLNIIGVAGLKAAIKYIDNIGVDTIHKQEIELCKKFINIIGDIPKVKIYGSTDWQQRVPIVPFNIGDLNSNDLGFILDKVYQVAVRTGLHCAPEAHKVLGTTKQGIVRVSPSIFNTEEEMLLCGNALKEIAKNH